MLWFRMAFMLCMGFTMVMALGIMWAELQIGVEGAKQQSIDADPAKNTTMGNFVFILLFQVLILGNGFFGVLVGFKVWQNNYQLDHKIRHLFIMWLACWCCAAMGLLGVCIYGLVKRKDQKMQMAFLYDVFSRNAQNNLFVASMERYQRQGNCCGIYGPDDWLMVQVRPMPMGGGGGGGSMRSMDYGFRQNPSTGKCHLVPPTIPIGCGQKIVEEVNVKLAMFAGLAIFETIIALATGVLAWYCFFYWLEKEVIVIPENEVSNLIIIEPESDQSIEAALNESGFGGASGTGGGSRYFQTGSRYIGGSSRPVTVMSLRHSQGGPPPQYPLGDVNSQEQAPGEGQQPGGSKQKTASQAAAGGEEVLLGGGPSSENQPGQGGSGSGSKSGPAIMHVPTGAPPGQYPPGQPPYPNQGGYPPPDAQNSRYMQQNQPYSRMGGSGYSQQPPPGYLRQPPAHHGGPQHPPPPPKMTDREKEKMVLKIQEKALGGKVLAEMHIDHKLDPAGGGKDPTAAADGKGRKKHATIAIVRNKKGKEKKAVVLGGGKGHGQTGHLAEDIAEMSGKKAGSYIEDVAIPLNNPHIVPLASTENVHHKPPGMKHGHGMDGSLAGSMAALDLENVLEGPEPKAADMSGSSPGHYVPYTGPGASVMAMPINQKHAIDKAKAEHKPLTPSGHLEHPPGAHSGKPYHNRSPVPEPYHRMHSIPLEHHVLSSRGSHHRQPYHSQDKYINPHDRYMQGSRYMPPHDRYMPQHDRYVNQHHGGEHDRYINQHHGGEHHGEHDRYIGQHHGGEHHGGEHHGGEHHGGEHHNQHHDRYINQHHGGGHGGHGGHDQHHQQHHGGGGHDRYIPHHLQGQQGHHQQQQPYNGQYPPQQPPSQQQQQQQQQQPPNSIPPTKTEVIFKNPHPLVDD